jgi:hypothetical protein
MKKSIFSTLFALTMILGLIFSVAPQDALAEAPCPTGFNEVASSWWPPSNDAYYTMCSCNEVNGYSASGGCSTGGDTPPTIAP